MAHQGSATYLCFATPGVAFHALVGSPGRRLNIPSCEIPLGVDIVRGTASWGRGCPAVVRLLATSVAVRFRHHSPRPEDLHYVRRTAAP